VRRRGGRAECASGAARGGTGMCVHCGWQDAQLRRQRPAPSPGWPFRACSDSCGCSATTQQSPERGGRRVEWEPLPVPMVIVCLCACCVVCAVCGRTVLHNVREHRGGRLPRAPPWSPLLHHRQGAHGRAARCACPLRGDEHLRQVWPPARSPARALRVGARAPLSGASAHPRAVCSARD
jgi:hypothetical protein